MAFLNRNVNLALLFLIAIVILGFAGTTVYFQRSFQGMNDQYNVKVDEVNSLITALKNEQNMSSETRQAFLSCSNQSVEEQKDFNVVVTDLTIDKNTLNATLMDTQSRLSLTLVTLSTTEGELSDKTVKLENAEALNEELGGKVDDYEGWVSRLSRDVNDLGALIEGSENLTSLYNQWDDVYGITQKLEDLR